VTTGSSWSSRWGADHTLNAKADSPAQLTAAIADLTGGEGVDAALERSGSPTAIHQAFRSVKNGGRVTLFGIPTGSVAFDLPNEIIFKGIRVYGVTGRRLFRTWYRLSGLFKAGLNIRPVITHTLPLTAFAQGFELVQSGKCGKVVLFP
jgi:threonine 3-dehydrogenase